MVSIDSNKDRFNKDQSVRTDAGEFLVEQRNAGFAENDGRWIVSHLPELYWSTAGVLRQRRPGAFLGVFDSPEEAETAISEAVRQPVADQMVR